MSVPEKGDYHYECAKTTGVFDSFETDHDKIDARADEIMKELVLLWKQKAKGVENEQIRRRCNSLEIELEFLSTQDDVAFRREAEVRAEKKKGV